MATRFATLASMSMCIDDVDTTAYRAHCSLLYHYACLTYTPTPALSPSAVLTAKQALSMLSPTDRHFIAQMHYTTRVHHLEHKIVEYLARTTRPTESPVAALSRHLALYNRALTDSPSPRGPLVLDTDAATRMATRNLPNLPSLAAHARARDTDSASRSLRAQAPDRRICVGVGIAC